MSRAKKHVSSGKRREVRHEADQTFVCTVVGGSFVLFCFVFVLCRMGDKKYSCTAGPMYTVNP